MRLKLEFSSAQAVLTVFDRGERTEVRGNPFVGAKFIGDTLDRLVAAFPKTVNTSDLFADNEVHLRPEDAQVIRACLKKENDLRQRLFASTWRV